MRSGSCEFKPFADTLNGIRGEAIDFGIFAFGRCGAMGRCCVVKDSFNLCYLEGAAFGQRENQRLSHRERRKSCSFRLQQSLLLGHAPDPANPLISQDRPQTRTASRTVTLRFAEKPCLKAG